MIQPLFNLIFIVQSVFSLCHSGKFCGECGKYFEDRFERIIGGQEAKPNSWPSTVLITFNYQFYFFSLKGKYSARCGGTLIDNDTIVTASHCFITKIKLNNNQIVIVRPNKYFPTYESMYKVYIGAHDAKNESVLPLEINSFTQHPNFDERLFLNDIGIIRLKNEIKFNEIVQPSCLPLSNFYPSEVNISAWTIGWGKTDEGILARFLNSVQIKIYDFDKCDQFKKKINDIQICAGDIVGNKDSCTGDSGGPLFVKDKIIDQEKYVFAGVVSYGLATCGLNYPAIYTRVSAYLDWIDEVANEDKNNLINFVKYRNVSHNLEINFNLFIFLSFFIKMI